jgi:hypothetical protein
MTCIPWTLVSGVPSPVSVTIAPNTAAAPYVIYVGTAGNGVYYSSNGTTWNTSGPSSVVAIARMPMPIAAFASLPDGSVQVTASGGASWTATTGSPNAVINDWIGVAGLGPLGASSNGLGSAIMFNGKSMGGTWVASTPFGTGVGTSITFGGGSSPNVIVYMGVSGSGGGVYKSTNVGSATMTFATTNFPQLHVLSVASAPSSLTTVFAGTSAEGAGIYVTTDGGTTWSPAGNGLGNTVVQTLAVDPTNANNVYAGTSSGVYVSKNGGGTWTFSGLGSSSVTSMAVLNGTPSTIYAVTSSGLYVTTTGGQ